MKKSFTVGQNVIWHTSDFEGESFIKAVVTEVYPDHAIARTQGNNDNTDDLTLYIDEDTEEDFI